MSLTMSRALGSGGGDGVARHRGDFAGHHQELDPHAVGISDARDLGSPRVIAVASAFDHRAAMGRDPLQRLVHVADADAEVAESELLTYGWESHVGRPGLMLELDAH